MTDMPTVNDSYRDYTLSRVPADRGHRMEAAPGGRAPARQFLQTTLCCVLGLACAWQAAAQGPKAAPASLIFNYQVNGTTPLPTQTVQITVPVALNLSVLSVAVVNSAANGWLTVTPDTGRAPLALSVMANPTNLSPGSYTGQITVTSTLAVSNPAVISVTLSITNPPSTLSVTSPAAPYYTALPPTLAFTYVTGDQALGLTPYPASAVLTIATTGSDPIQFSVTASSTGAAASFLRVWATAQTPALSTVGFAFPAGPVPITVSLDPVNLDTLLPGPYFGTIAVVATNKVNGSASVAVSLQVSAGLPKVTSIWPASVSASPTVAPVIDIIGDNFFSTSVVTLVQNGSVTPITVPYKLVSRKQLQATIPISILTPTVTAPVTNPLGAWTIVVTNPGQAAVPTAFTVTSGTVPSISTVVDAASYLPAAVQIGTTPDPVLGLQTVAPREIISIFGQNLGPATLLTAIPAATPPATAPLSYGTTLGGVTVTFSIPIVTAGVPGTLSVDAPLIMVSINQINAIVPREVIQAVAAAPGPSVTITVKNGAISTLPVKVYVVAANPAIFSFAGLGQGQAAVLNYDSATSSYVINSSKNAAARGSTISIYATGMGDLIPAASAPVLPCVSPLVGAALGSGEVACSAITLPNFGTEVNVFIDGQLSVVNYAGTSPGSVGGLIQINAVVPPTAHVGAAITITTSVGPKATARRSQPLVTMGVK